MPISFYFPCAEPAERACSCSPTKKRIAWRIGMNTMARRRHSKFKKRLSDLELEPLAMLGKLLWIRAFDIRGRCVWSRWWRFQQHFLDWKISLFFLFDQKLKLRKLSFMTKHWVVLRFRIFFRDFYLIPKKVFSRRMHLCVKSRQKKQKTETVV